MAGGLGEVLAGQEDRGVNAAISALEELRVLRYRPDQDSYEVGMIPPLPRVGMIPPPQVGLVPTDAPRGPIEIPRPQHMMIGAELLRSTIRRHLGRGR